MRSKQDLFHRMNKLLIASLLLSILLFIIGNLRSKETVDTINLIVTLSVTMAGFGLVAFQIGHHASPPELKNDFIESSIIMSMSTIFGFFFLTYPGVDVGGFNFGDLAILLFFWGFFLFIIVIVDKGFKIT